MFPGTVANIAALRAAPISPVFSGPVIVEGFSTAGDGGGGVFYWSTSGAYSLDDNIGIVITSNAGGSGRWRREGFEHHRNATPADVNGTNQAINVKWFGAKGDGTTDDSAAIQNAVNAADLIRQNLWSIVPGPSYLGGYGPTPTVLLPDGTYTLSGTVNGNTGIDMGGCVLIFRGVGSVTLGTLDSTLNLIRVGAHCRVENITFRGGLHQIAMYGYNTVTHTPYDPTAFGNVPIVFDKCNFVYPVGPAIWQDSGPSTTVASGSNAVSLPIAGGVLNVVNSVPFTAYPTGSLVVNLQDGTYQTLAYTGRSGNTFTGVTGGTGTLHTGDSIVIPTLWRSFQSTLRVTNFQFAGAHLFWGAGDTVIFSQGHVEWDFTTTQTSGDGYPLGIWNSSDTVYVNNVTAFGAGAQAARCAMFVGVGLIKFNATTWGQNDFLCFIRQRIHANTYLTANGVPITLPYGSNAPAGLDVNIDDINLVSAFGAFWLEVYEQFPYGIRLKNWSDVSNDFEGTFGIWLDSSVDLPTALGQHTARQYVEFDGFQDWGMFSFHRGFDPGASAAPSKYGSTDVTDALRLCRIQADMPGGISSQVNLFNTITADGSSVPPNFTLDAGSLTTDNSTGYPVTLWTATTPLPYSASFGAAHSSDWLASNIPAGIYCFSFYWKSNFAGSIFFTFAPQPNAGVTQAVRKYEASDQWQRIWVPFYYPGNNADWMFQGVTYLAGGGQGAVYKVNAWVASTNYTALGTRVTNGGNVYLLRTAGIAAGSGGPTGTGGNIVDNAARWDYVGPGGTFTPAAAMGLMMVNKGRNPSPYVFPANNDSAADFGWVPRIYYGTAAPTAGAYRVGDITYNTAPAAAGVIGWVCTTAGSPGTWKTFGAIQA